MRRKRVVVNCWTCGQRYRDDWSHPRDPDVRDLLVRRRWYQEPDGRMFCPACAVSARLAVEHRKPTQPEDLSNYWYDLAYGGKSNAGAR